MKLANAWNTFLDTTPRQWGRAVARAVGVPVEAFRWHFASWRAINPRSVTSLCVYASIFLHVAGVAAFTLRSELGLAEKAGEAVEVTLVDDAGGAPVEPEIVWDDTSDIVIPKPKPKKKSLAERMLERYQKLKVSGADKVKPAYSNRPRWRGEGTSPNAQTGKLGQVDLSRQLAVESAADPGADKFSKAEMNQHLAKYQGQLQACYERALLQDQSLNGKVTFALRAGPGGQIAQSDVRFDGVGLPAAREGLRGCLLGVVRGIRLPMTFAASFGRTIQFQAVLSM